MRVELLGLLKFREETAVELERCCEMVECLLIVLEVEVGFSNGHSDKAKVTQDLYRL